MTYDGAIVTVSFYPELIMIRYTPTAWTATYVALSGLATWLLCETDTLGGAATLFLH